MTISTDPWKLFRVVLALAVVTLMFVRIGPEPFYDDGRGCSMMHQE